MEIDYSTLANNSALNGGAVAGTGGSLVLVNYSTLSQNKATLTTLSTRGQPVLPIGTDVTNRMGMDGPMIHMPLGGGPVGGGVYTEVPSIFLNSTFSSNTTTGDGGGIYAGTSTVLSFVTLSANRAAKGGSIYSAVGATERVWLKNSLLNAGGPYNCQSTNQDAFSSYGGNLSSDHSCDAYFTQPTDQNGKNPRLGALANNGGPTMTHALLLGSPAIHHAVNCQDAYGVTVPFDQRLKSRPTPLGARCDIGAYESR